MGKYASNLTEKIFFFQISNLNNSTSVQDISLKQMPLSYIFKELSIDTKYIALSLAWRPYL